MKHINQFITEYIIKKKLDTPINSEHKYHPQTKEELIENIKELLDKEETDFNCIDTSEITDMSNLFSDSYIDGNTERIIIKDMNINISNWNVSNVTNMGEMFNNCCSFDCDLSNWNVSNVEDMQYMFVSCKNFTGKGLENWNVSNLKYMAGMFEGCQNFTGTGLENWDVSKVTGMSEIFSECIKFDCDLSKWNVSNVKDMFRMFDGCKIFKGKGLDKWDVSNAVDMSFMFDGCLNLNCDLSKWNVKNVKYTNRMFTNCNSLKKLPTWYKK